MMSQSASQTKIKRTVLKLTVVAVLMFGFGFALVPLYRVFCEVTGLNGKTGGEYTASESAVVDTSRLVTVQFITLVNDGMPWQFKPGVKNIEANPGKVYRVKFYAKNPTDKQIVGQAVPSVTPGLTAQYFKKTECFCFTQQVLNGGQSIEMPMVFMLDPELPAKYKTVTLSYTMFNASGLKPPQGQNVGRF